MPILSEQARTVRKSDYTPALALSKHMASVFDKKCREKEKGILNRRKPVLNPTIQQATVNLYNILSLLFCKPNMSFLSYIFGEKTLRERSENIWKNI